MNEGKTLSYFSAVARMSHNVNFVYKADMDEFVHIDNLANTIQSFAKTFISNEYIYHGRLLGSFPIPEKGFFMGCIYGMSFNLVQHFAVEAEARAVPLNKGEDAVSSIIASRISASTQTNITWVNDLTIHDHPDCGCLNAAPFRNESTGIHQLKAFSLWKSTLIFFFGQGNAATIFVGLTPRSFPGLRIPTCRITID